LNGNMASHPNRFSIITSWTGDLHHFWFYESNRSITNTKTNSPFPFFVYLFQVILTPRPCPLSHHCFHRTNPHIPHLTLHRKLHFLGGMRAAGIISTASFFESGRSIGARAVGAIPRPPGR
jgi:hypothetical protein